MNNLADISSSNNNAYLCKAMDIFRWQFHHVLHSVLESINCSCSLSICLHRLGVKTIKNEATYGREHVHNLTHIFC